MGINTGWGGGGGSTTITANRAAVSNGSGALEASATTATEIGYLSGVTSAVQTQLNAKAASSHNHAASDINSGTVATARLGSGTADSTTYLRGDQTWATVSAGAEWQTATQASNGNTLTLTLGTTGDVFNVVGQITSQSASSATEIEFNGSTGSHSYRHHFSGGVDNNAGGYFPPGVVGSGVTCIFRGTVERIGELIIADLLVTLPTALSHSEVRKTITGATNINALRVFSNQANGIGAGSYISAQKVK